MDEDIPDSIPRRSHSAATEMNPPCPLQKRKEAPEHCNERGLTEDISTKGPLTITRKEPAHHNYRPPTSKAELERSSHTAVEECGGSPTTTKEETSLILKRSSPAHHHYKENPQATCKEELPTTTRDEPSTETREEPPDFILRDMLPTLRSPEDPQQIVMYLLRLLERSQSLQVQRCNHHNTRAP